MAKKLTLILTAILFVAATFVIATAQEGEKTAKAEKVEKEVVKHEYVGDKKCSCHNKDGVHPSWLETKHAKAFAALKPEQQKDAKCVGCHTTGTTAKGELLEGIQCEACHGPGSDYKTMKVMKDMKLAMENGLMMPDEKTCLKCHNENVPEEFRSKEKFDFEKMKAKGVHAMPVKEKVEEKKG
ncbi:MAG: cytochrome c family protein [candidate division Zixibacteria bacterium]|nr:cytochrome c family protein [candidate division Zixibacteria bacterium]MBU1470655.1 cytochrome c family protein [candidate division Zixibacteria bacterium]MBU2624124.1 cytochrome c family protein [candidate division Zixibacteria bacterium]